MKFVFIFSVVLAVAHGSHWPPAAEECSGLNDGRSLLAGMLDGLGFNQTCVSAALDFCASAQEDGDLRSFIEVRPRLHIQEQSLPGIHSGGVRVAAAVARP